VSKQNSTVSGNGLENAADKTAQFMSRVVAWPNADGPGYINLEWQAKNARLGKTIWTGKPLKAIDTFLALADQISHEDSVTNIYFCLSQQSQCRETPKGQTIAHRSKETATFLKAIWLDIDVKDSAKGYSSLHEAFAALSQFIAHYSLPSPSAVVLSGGGIHVYWINNRPLTVAEWQPYANGLKAAALSFGLRCDAGVTSDAARVLRVPGTKNWKTDPPKPVCLQGIAEEDHDFPIDLKMLPLLAPKLKERKTESKWDEELFPKHDEVITESLSDGLGLSERDKPLPVEPIAAGCRFVRYAIESGGKDYSQPLWNLTTLCATFLENGNELAHNMGNQHPGYSHEDTEELWARKNRERSDKRLGWPSCAAIQDAGCKHCKECPHFSKAKSPLHLALAGMTSTAKNNSSHLNNTNPVERLMELRRHGADMNALLAAMNENYAVVKYGGQTLVATISGGDIGFMKVDDFHRMFANLVVYIEAKGKDGATKKHAVKLSRHWFDWEDRRQYLGRGVVFEPGSPLEIPNDMLNLWRGFGVAPKSGDWRLMHAHILNVVCSGDGKLFEYLINWIAYAVQHPGKPTGVAVAFLGPQGAGKGVVARTFGSFFGKHFVHITHGDQLTGRFNASLGTACAVFLDEALWAGDKKGEGTLKALITEPTFQMEAKHRDPIMVENRLRILVASNSDWAVPTGVGDRRWFVLNVANTYAGTGHRDYWIALYAEIENGGAAAMLYDLLAMDLSKFDVHAIPHTKAKAQQQAHSFRGTTSWLYDVLQEGAIGYNKWGEDGLTIEKTSAYQHYKEFSKERREWQPEIKDLWSKKIRKVLSPCVEDVRETIGAQRVRSLKFASLADCRRQFEAHVGAPDIEWESAGAPEPATVATVRQTSEEVGDPIVLDAVHGAPSIQCEPELEPEDWPEYEPDYESDCEPDYEPDCE
jgi:hypothetical protein